MYRFVPYTTLFVVVSLLQILFFNNLSVSVSLSPLCYVVFILLLPLQITHFATLMLGLLMGLLMDISMGLAGINTIATLFVAFVRPYLISVVSKKETLSNTGVPSGVSMGEGAYTRYLILFGALHHAVFFALETLSLANLNLYFLRFGVSLCVSLIFIWLIARVFVVMVFRKV